MSETEKKELIVLLKKLYNADGTTTKQQELAYKLKIALQQHE
jgi:hypothetical protein